MVGIPMDGVGWGVLECGCYCTASIPRVGVCGVGYTSHDCSLQPPRGAGVCAPPAPHFSDGVLVSVPF